MGEGNTQYPGIILCMGSANKRLCYIVMSVSLAEPIPRMIPGGCFTNDSRALQNILSKFLHYRYPTSDENFKPKLCTCAQSHALSTRTKFRLEILTINVISGTVYFCEIILESSQNVSETTPRYLQMEFSKVSISEAFLVYNRSPMPI